MYDGNFSKKVGRSFYKNKGPKNGNLTEEERKRLMLAVHSTFVKLDNKSEHRDFNKIKTSIDLELKRIRDSCNE